MSDTPFTLNPRDPILEVTLSNTLFINDETTMEFFGLKFEKGPNIFPGLTM